MKCKKTIVRQARGNGNKAGNTHACPFLEMSLCNSFFAATLLIFVQK